VQFRWQLDKWQQGPFRQIHFHFADLSKYTLRNHQPPESSNLELILKPARRVTADEVWHIEALVHHAFDPQMSVAVYSPLVLTSVAPEAKLVTPLSLLALDQFLFPNNTLCIDIQISEREFVSSGLPAAAGSSLPAPHSRFSFVGLQNLGSSSYVNDVLVALFHIPRLRQIVYSIEGGGAVVRELQRLFGTMAIRSRCCSARLLMKAVGWSPTKVLCRRARRDFVQLLLGHIREAGGAGTGIEDLFAIRYLRPHDALETDFPIPQADCCMNLTLEVRGNSSLADAVAQFMLFGTGDEFPYGSELIDFPPVLVINLRRFLISPRSGRREVISDCFPYQDTLDLTPYVNGPQHDYTYDLFGVLSHFGRPPSGLFSAYLKLGGDWQHFNDSSVSAASPVAAAGNFGGKGQSHAYMLIYVCRDAGDEVFCNVDVPQHIQDFVSSVGTRPPTSPKGDASPKYKTVKLISDLDIKKFVLHGGSIFDLRDYSTEIPIEDDWTNGDLYMRVGSVFGRQVNMLRLWKVDRSNMPVATIPDNQLRFLQEDVTVYVQELPDARPMRETAVKIAFLSFFAPAASPQLQFIGSAALDPGQPATHLFPMLWALLASPRIAFNIYCEGREPIAPISQATPLRDLGITGSASFMVEAPGVVETFYGFDRLPQLPPDPMVVSYFTKVKPSGDTSLAQYLERKRPQLHVEIFMAADRRRPRVSVRAPETLCVTELPGLILFATKDKFNPEKDTFQMFRRQIRSDLNEIMPYLPRPDVTIKSLFVVQIRKHDPLQLFYDIIHGYTAEQLKELVVRTVDVYDEPLHWRCRVRKVMSPDEPLEQLRDHIQRYLCPCQAARLLVERDGRLSMVERGQDIDESTVIRFEPVPLDQMGMQSGEYLIAAVVCRAEKVHETVLHPEKGFLFKVIPEGVIDNTRERIGQFKFIDDLLLPCIGFMVDERILREDDRLDEHVKPFEVLKLVLPDRMTENAKLRTARKEHEGRLRATRG
jgi:hypothetical protein